MAEEILTKDNCTSLIEDNYADLSPEKFEFVSIKNDEIEKISSPEYSYWRSVWRNFISSKVSVIMMGITLFVFLASFLVPLITGYNHFDTPYVNDFSKHYLLPSLSHPFGTDQVGRDLFAGIWTGTRTSLLISCLATFISVGIGVVVGAFWGYSKKIDLFMIELYNIVSNVPFTLLVMVLLYVLGSGVKQLIFALCCTTWLSVAYFIRIQVIIIRDREYNLASRCLGTSISKIILHNVLPFLISVIVTNISRTVPMFISMEVFLSYIGIGLSSDIASLGQMIQEFSGHMQAAPHMFWIPVFISSLISVSLYIVGQNLADASDPKTHLN